MKEKSNNHISISYKTIKEIFRRRLDKIPTLYYHVILKEMEEMKLIEKIGVNRDLAYKFKARNLDKQLNKLVNSSLF